MPLLPSTNVTCPLFQDNEMIPELNHAIESKLHSALLCHKAFPATTLILQWTNDEVHKPQDEVTSKYRYKGSEHELATMNIKSDAIITPSQLWFQAYDVGKPIGMPLETKGNVLAPLPLLP